MPNAPWARLAEPFPAAALAWHVVGRDADGSRLRLAPHLSSEALRARLDDVVGPEGWSLRLRAWGEAGLLAELAVLGATRAGAVRLAPAPGATAGPEAATAAAFAAAAAGFGMLTPLVVADDGWVDADPDSGEHLHLPDTLARGDAAGEGDAAGDEADEVPLASTSEASAAGGEAAVAPEAPEPKPEAQRMIDRLMERLREEGLGAEAAKLVMSYGGYGRDPQASRELYARLRSLLIERGARS